MVNTQSGESAIIALLDETKRQLDRGAKRRRGCVAPVGQVIPALTSNADFEAAGFLWIDDPPFLTVTPAKLTKLLNLTFLLSKMARLQFKQLDVESMAKLYGQKEPKQKATQLKRQYQRGEQRQQSPIPPSMLPPALELDFGTLITSETQPTTHTSAASGNFCGVNGQDRTEVDWNQEPNDVARILYPMAPPFGIGPITEVSMNRSSLDETASPPEFRLPHTPLPVQLPSEQSSRKEPSHYYQELFLFPDLGKSSMAQIHPASRLASNMNTAIPGDHESRESGKSYESCGSDDPASSNCSSADGETHGQSYSQESMGSGPEPTSQDLPGTAASQVVPGSFHITQRATPVTNSEDNSEDNGGSDSESVGSDYGASTILHSQKAKSGKRRHWTPLEELRLRAWYEEEKDPRWMARKLGRPKGGVEQHWKKICTQDKKGRK
ncbi:hypothetical protein CGGC5_v015940 [Colletotrichum fructicola Nara gc5]|uniref:Myb-like domain-containing protein n=1 Tax=Colletotrichum fructicola (strain Nara gc5) TaxID=1213859 RepID=A0A7J6IJI0_COLFN|nr:hypothetical protein CGGC5_v015940 [Colletotrichum fructicola Nara gc5]